MSNIKELTEDVVDLKQCVVALEKHAETSNREVGVIQTDIAWVKEAIKEIKAQTWWILTTIVIGFLISIYLK